MMKPKTNQLKISDMTEKVEMTAEERQEFEAFRAEKEKKTP